MVAKNSTRRSGAVSASKKQKMTKLEALEKARAAVKNRKGGAVTAQKKAGLKMPPSRFHKMLRRDRIGKTVRKDAAVAMAACVEYIIAELCELAGNITQEKKKKQMNNRHLLLAIQGDEEFTKFFGGSAFGLHGAGLNPTGIHEKLLPKKGKGKGAKGEESANVEATQEV